jgi:hypothetical protein
MMNKARVEKLKKQREEAAKAKEKEDNKSKAEAKDGKDTPTIELPIDEEPEIPETADEAGIYGDETKSDSVPEEPEESIDPTAPTKEEPHTEL